MPNHTTLQPVLCETALQTPRHKHKCAHTQMTNAHTEARCPHVEHMLQSGVHAGVFWWPQRAEFTVIHSSCPLQFFNLIPLYLPTKHTHTHNSMIHRDRQSSLYATKYTHTSVFDFKWSRIITLYFSALSC